MKRKLVSAVLVCCFCCTTAVFQAMALTDNSNGPGKGSEKSDNPEKPNVPGKPDNQNKPGRPGHRDAPFDGGLMLLIGAGLAFSVKKAYDKRTSSNLKS